MSEDPDISFDQMPQSEATQAATTEESDADMEFGLPGDMATDDGNDSWDAAGEEGDAGDGDAEVALDTATTNTADGLHDDELIATIVGVLDMHRGDAFMRQLIEGLGQTDIAGPLAPLLRQLRLDLGDRPDETGAFELFVDNLDDPALDRDDLVRAVPVLAALTARTIVRGLALGSGKVSVDARRHLVRQAVAATHQLLRNRREGGLASLPLVACYLGRRALRRDAAPGALAEALSRMAARLSSEPVLMRRLVRTGTSRSDRTWRGTWGHPRHFTLHGPMEIMILAC